MTDSPELLKDGEQSVENEEDCLARHRKEKKELQVEVQRLKHSVPKGDKKRKKEVTAQIAVLESELDERQDQEMKELRSRFSAIQVTENCESAVTATDGIANGLSEAADKKPSKAQRRKDKKSQQLVEREERIRDQEIRNLSGPRHIEAGKIKAALKERGLSIKEIPSDGNCLYAAIADQLQQTQHKESSVKSLRFEAADYLRKHSDEFLPFLIKEGTEETYSEEEYMAYCQRIESTSEWGGHTEIRALSDVLCSPIEVIQADGANVIIGENLPGNRLVVTYHRHAYGLGEHYNSVVPETKADDEGFS